MKTRVIVAFVLLFICVIGLLIWPRQAHSPAASISAPPSDVGLSNQRPAHATALTSADPLKRAVEMAAFINKLIDSVAVERVETRDHLRGIQAVFFASDYIMSEKSNGLPVSRSAVTAAFGKVAGDKSVLEERLAYWAVRPGTLTDHYRSISENPEARDQISAIKAALADNGVPIDTESQLLMDCIRYGVHCTAIQEMYGQTSKEGPATPFPAALKSLTETGDAVFQHRFVSCYGLDPVAVSKLTNRIKEVRVYGLSPADVEIPVVHFE